MYGRLIEAGPKLKKFNYCISKMTGKVAFNVPRAGFIGRDATLEPLDNSVPVEKNSITIEDFMRENNLDHIDVMKMDIEGAELDVLDSISLSVLAKIDQLSVEFHEFIYPDTCERVEAVKRRVVGAGFYGIKFTRNNVDVLFLNKEKFGILVYFYLKYIYRSALFARKATGKMMRFCGISHRA